MPISNNPLLLVVSTFMFLSLLPSCPLAINITETLSEYPDLSLFNHYLTETNLAAVINNGTSVTVLAVGNADIAPLARLNKQELKEAMSVHVLHDYYDMTLFKAQVFGGRFAIPNFLRHTQSPYNKIGYVHVTLVPTGAIYFSSAEAGSRSPAAQLIKSLVSLPVDVSVLQISAPILPLSLDKSDDSDIESSPFGRMTRRYRTNTMNFESVSTMAEGPGAVSPTTPLAPKAPAPESPAPKSPTPVAPAPKAPTPVAPAPKAPAPVAPTPKSPSPVAPAPKSPAPVAPTPKSPSPVAPAPKSPAPVAPAPKSPSPENSPKSAPSPQSPNTPAPAPGQSTPPTPSTPTNSPPTPSPVNPINPPTPSTGPAPATPHSGPFPAPIQPPTPGNVPTHAPTPSYPVPSPRSGPVPSSPGSSPSSSPPESSPDSEGPSPGPAPSSPTTPSPAPADEPTAEEPSEKNDAVIGVKASLSGLLVAILLSSIMERLV